MEDPDDEISAKRKYFMLLLSLVETKSQTDRENFEDSRIDIQNFLLYRIEELKKDMKSEVEELKKEARKSMGKSMPSISEEI